MILSAFLWRSPPGQLQIEFESDTCSSLLLVAKQFLFLSTELLSSPLCTDYGPLLQGLVPADLSKGTLLEVNGFYLALFRGAFRFEGDQTCM